MIKVIIFDLDDTLVNCAPYYIDAINLAAKDISYRTNIPEPLCLDLIEVINKTRAKLDDGYSKHAFPRSLAAASAAVDILLGNEVDATAAESCYLLGESVFKEQYPPFHGVPELLEELSQNYTLYIWTKGDPIIQMDKILNNNLLKYFDPGNIFIVPHKTKEHIQGVLQDIRSKRLVSSSDEILLVGDSLRDDIRTANEQGWQNIWIRNDFNKNDSLIHELQVDHIIDTDDFTDFMKSWHEEMLTTTVNN